MNKKYKILVIGDEGADRLKQLDDGVQLSENSPLAITVWSQGAEQYELYQLTNDRRNRVYLGIYLDIVQFDMALYVCSALQSERDMKNWFKMLPQGTFKLLFLCSQPGYLGQCKVLDRVSSCFHRKVHDSMVFLEMRQKPLLDIIREGFTNNTLKIDEYLRQTNAISRFKWLLRSKTPNSAI